MIKNTLLCAAAVLTVGLTAAFQEAKAPAKAPTDREIAEAQRPAYPLDTCVVSGEELSADETYETVVDGRLYRLCCKKCEAAIQKDPAKFEAKVVAAVIADQGPRYPLTTCPMSGEKLGDDAIDHVDGTKLVRFCCKKCIAGYAKDPAAVMAKVDAAWIAAQLPSYPFDTCIVSHEPLSDPETGSEPIDYLYGTRLIRVCCKSCIKKIKKNPAKYLAMLE